MKLSASEVIVATYRGDTPNLKHNYTQAPVVKFLPLKVVSKYSRSTQKRKEEEAKKEKDSCFSFSWIQSVLVWQCCTDKIL